MNTALRPDRVDAGRADLRLTEALLLTLVAAALRVAAPSHLAIDHFDEGGYAMTSAAVVARQWHDSYPLQHFLSPPVFFGLGSVMAMATGAVPAGLFTVSIAAGIATVPLVYLLGCHWWGRPAGGAAALAVALSDFHVLYSRAGLTDVLFTGLLLLAVALCAEAERRESMRLSVVAGIVTGLAWNTKYHGWLALVIAGVAGLPIALRRGQEWWRTAARLVVSGAVAACVYLPWAIYIQSQPGGYAALAAEHARFLRPLRAFQSTLTQISFQRYLEGWGARLTPLVMCAWIAWIDPRRRQWATAALGVVLTLGALALGSTIVLGMLAALGCGVMLRAYDHRLVTQWYPLAFLLVFSGLTPLYRPYARLVLPWLIAAAIVAPLGVQQLLDWRWTPTRWKAAAALSVLLAAAMVALGLPPAAMPWRSRATLRAAAETLNRIVPADAPILVIGEPGTVFYLRAAGRRAWHIDQAAQASRHVSGTAYFLVGGIYSRRYRGEGSLPQWLAQHPDAVPAGTVAITDMSDVRLLDDFLPRGAYRFRTDPRGDYDLHVFRVPSAAR